MKKYVGVLVLLIAVFAADFASAGIRPVTDADGRESSSINDSSE